MDSQHISNEQLRHKLLAQRVKALRSQAEENTQKPTSTQLNPAVERMWQEQQRNLEATHLNVGVVLHLDTDLDGEKLTQAVHAVAKVHPALHSTYHLDEQGNLTVHTDTSLLPLVEEHTLAEHPDPDARTRRREVLARRLSDTPFDLSTEAPLRVMLIHGGDEHGCDLVLCAHHIAWDDDAWTIFLTDLATAYDHGADALSAAGMRPDMLFVPAGRSATEEYSKRAYTHWRSRLVPLPEPLELPGSINAAAHPRDAREFHLPITAAVLDNLDRLAQSAQASRFQTFLALWGYVLSRYTGSGDMVLACPIIDPAGAGQHGAIGYRGTVLPVRVTVNEDVTCAEFVRSVAADFIADLAHGEGGLESIIAHVVESGSANVVKAREVLTVGASTRGDLRRCPMPGHAQLIATYTASTNADLLVDAVLADEGDAPAVILRYRSSVISDVAVENLACSLVHVLTSARAKDVLGAVDVLTQKHHDTLAACEFGPQQPVEETTLPEKIEHALSRWPETTAVISEQQHVTYTQFGQLTRRLARELLNQGVQTGDLVAAVYCSSADFFAAATAIMMAGGVYVPLDPAVPDDRLAYLINDSNPALILTDSILEQRIIACADGRTVMVREQIIAGTISEQAEDDAAPIRDEERSRPLRPEDPAYVIYTSGSTGLPKGVVVPHRAVVDYLVWLDRDHDITGERLLQIASPSFDVSIGEFFGTLTNGATLIVPQREGLKDIANLTGLIHQHQVTSLHAVPSLLAALLMTPVVASWTSVRRLPVGGEAFPAEVARKLLATIDVELFNFYGPTETTLAAMRHRVDGSQTSGTLPIGRPLGNTTIMLLDERLRRVPVGAPGQIFIGGPQLAIGYLNRPEATQQAFMPHPFNAGERVYATGDLGRWNAHGDMEFLGRMDEQVKIRGLRVELGEISATLRAIPGVAQAAAGVVEHPQRGTVPVAWLVAEPGADQDSDRVRHAVAMQLPDYMVPVACVWVDEIPLMVSGKIDRASLPQPDLDRITVGRPPQGETEIYVAGVFADVLGREGVEDANASFFDLGGHSLLATRLISRIRRETGVDVPVKVAFNNPTIDGLAQWIDNHRTTARREDALENALEKEESHELSLPERAPLSAAQRRLWFLHSSGVADSSYAIPLSVDLRGPVDLSVLALALRDVIARHESLRTRYPVGDDGQPWLEVLDPPTADEVLRYIDARSWDDAAVEQAIAEESAREFDLAAAAPIAATVFERGENEWLLLVVMHHICVDEWSVQVIWRDLSAAYEHRLAHPDSATPLPRGRDYREVIARVAQPDEEAIDFWRQQLAGVDASVPVFADRGRSASPDQRGATVSWSISSEVRDALLATAQEVGATGFMVLACALSTLLRDHGAGPDVTVGAPVSGRRHLDSQDCVGLFVNTIVLRTDMSDPMSFRQRLQHMADIATVVYEHDDVPYETIVDVAQVARSPLYQPLFQAFVDLHPRQPESFALGENIEVIPREHHDTSAKFDLLLDARDTHAGWQGTLNYAKSLYDEETAATLARRLVLLLETWAFDPDLRDDQRSVFSAQELAEIERFSQGEVLEYAPDSVCEMLVNCEHPRTRPVSPAVTCRGETTDCASVHARATAIAVYLRNSGIGPGSCVAVATDRGVDAVAALVAVMDLGAAYLPLDLRLPEQHLHQIIDDANPDVIVGHERANTIVGGLSATTTPLINLSDPDVAAALAAANPTGAVRLRDVVDAPLPEATDPAYIVYTSGSTGRPKGVVGPQRALAARVSWQPVDYPVSDPDVRLAQGALSFLDGVIEVIAGVLAGAQLVMADDAQMVDVEAIAKLLEDYPIRQVTAVAGVSALLCRLVPQAVARVERWVCSGEPLTQDVLDLIQQTAPNTQVVNAYGTTESAGSIVRTTLESGVLVLGRPVRGTQIRLCDDFGRLVPIGVVGELVATGPQVAQGYLRRPELTSEKFSGEGTRRTYRTGDRGFWNAQGEIRFVGRTDHQVKIRGQRVELGEVDAAMRTLAGVEAAAARVATTDQGTGIYGYVVLAKDHDWDELAALAQLRQILPSAAVPVSLTVVSVLPTTQSGKIDRRALPEPKTSAREVSGLMPRTPTEKIVAQQMAAVLGRESDSLGCDDDFFDAGGDSIAVLRLLNAIRSQVGVAPDALNVQDVFASPTIATLAAEIDRVKAQQPEQVESVEVAESAPMSASGLAADELDAILNEFGR
ncbi:MAG: amino acid adenylation domain-containing protein [Corynebacterium sp.]|uniref:non-ribosomal peptide synthetase n=1 Tax=Corynebacterium sp. TaxID=1720 RepID=UPI0026DA725F|nr:non-ribosomal peptide synthetase [Corynebacterium sp.]MDO4760461.1 amino acid adenylation domain-containing protein [Corynebacterium sp.]